MSASVGLPLHRQVQKFSSGTGSPGWSRERGRKMVVVVVVLSENGNFEYIVTVRQVLSLSVIFAGCNSTDANKNSVFSRSHHLVISV